MCGFTLIELIATLIIIGIISVTAVGRMDFASAAGPKSVRDKAVAALQFARKAAVAQRRNVCVCVGTKAGSTCTLGSQLLFGIDKQAPETGAAFCTTYGAGTNELALPLSSRDTNCTAGVTNAVCSRSGATIGTAGGGPAFCFDAQGRALDGSCAAAATTVVTITDPTGAVLSVTVEGETGYVH